MFMFISVAPNFPDTKFTVLRLWEFDRMCSVYFHQAKLQYLGWENLIECITVFIITNLPSQASILRLGEFDWMSNICLFISVAPNLPSHATVLRLGECDRRYNICLCLFQSEQIYQAKRQYLCWENFRIYYICLCLFQLLQIYQAKLQYLGWENLIEWVTYVCALLLVIDFNSCQRTSGYRFVSSKFNNKKKKYVCFTLYLIFKMAYWVLVANPWAQPSELPSTSCLLNEKGVVWL